MLEAHQSVDHTSPANKTMGGRKKKEINRHDLSIQHKQSNVTFMTPHVTFFLQMCGIKTFILLLLFNSFWGFQGSWEKNLKMEL